MLGQLRNAYNLEANRRNHHGIAIGAEWYYHVIMKTLTVKLPESLAVWLAQRAKALGRPQSELMRDALERSRNSDTPSCHDLMADFCGTVHGPKDLSTHPKHLDDFGK